MRLPLVLCLLLAACGTTYALPDAGSGTNVSAAPVDRTGRARTNTDFNRVLGRVMPQTERFCRQEVPDAPPAFCDYKVVLISDPKAPPNAFQRRGENGRPEIGFAASLLPIMRSDDEIAFVLSHEAAHHIAGHISKQQQQGALGAVIVGGLASAVGTAYGVQTSQQTLQDAMNIGASVGARSYSQTYELEADTVGAYIAARAGYNAERGAGFFQQPELASEGGLPILVSHPGSTRRQSNMANVWADIREQEAQGRTPTPRRSN